VEGEKMEAQGRSPRPSRNGAEKAYLKIGKQGVGEESQKKEDKIKRGRWWCRGSKCEASKVKPRQLQNRKEMKMKMKLINKLN
jgi:hypothetical protein